MGIMIDITRQLSFEVTLQMSYFAEKIAKVKNF